MKAPLNHATLKEGDVVAIAAGDRVPADLRLLEAEDLEVDEFDLSGEIAPVPKRTDAEESGRVLRGSRVLRGRGLGVVVAAGERTEYGQILRQPPIGASRPETPPFRTRHLVLPLALAAALLLRLLHGGEPLTALATYGGAALLLWRLQDHGRLRSAALQRQRAALARSGVRLRDAQALQAMLSVDLIGFDKTGVLTSRDLKVRWVFLGGEWADGAAVAGGGAWHLVLTACALCHDAGSPDRRSDIGPLDRALMAYAAEHGLETAAARWGHPRIYLKPFLPGERYMAAGFARGGGGAFYFAKGDPEAILKICAGFMARCGETRPMDPGFRAQVLGAVETAARDGSIVLALAYAEGASPPPAYRFLCLVQLENPVTPQAGPTVRALASKGIRSIMLTGDRIESALGAAHRSGIQSAAGLFLTGKDLSKMDFAEIVRQSAYVSVYARLLPSQKGLVVNALRQAGYRVAMVGDGANDAIAMRAAEVGVGFSGYGAPLARRSARVLIRNLSDILRVIEAAQAGRRRARVLAALAAVLLFGLLLSGPLPDLAHLAGRWLSLFPPR
jgi:Ca2+-transporting ATPase